jgi:acyl-coenzyme A synthetase/AMP-(fatty) acid ligase
VRAASLPLQYNATGILERNLAQRADKVALYSESRNMTFRQVADEANQVGNALAALDIRMGEFVGILSPDVPEWVASLFGILKIGAVAIGMNTLLKPHEYEYILHDSCARALIVHESLLPAVQGVCGNSPFLKHVIVIGQREGYQSYAAWIAGRPTTFETAPTHRNDFCSLNYSSGTTGEPKDILHAHKDYLLTAMDRKNKRPFGALGCTCPGRRRVAAAHHKAECGGARL